MLLLQGCCLQHKVLLLGSVHLLQVLRGCARLPVQCLLNHLRSRGGGNKHVSWLYSMSSLRSCVLRPSPSRLPRGGPRDLEVAITTPWLGRTSVRRALQLSISNV